MHPARRPNARRGVTLLEMLVVVALVVLMMLILASIFQAATGAMTTMRAYQEMDDSLRLLDLTIRRDLAGTTAKMTPPNNPLFKTGYFEYGENAPSDLQGEDTDDYLAFTCKAPEGQFFTGRVWVPPTVTTTGANGTGVAYNPAVQPVTITSQYAEIIYFLRNGNLYRRVLLIAPERQGTLAVSAFAAPNTLPPNSFNPYIFNNTINPNQNPLLTLVSWQGVNDISARPNDAPASGGPNDNLPIPNDLGTLTNREYRFARPRFCKDYFNILSNSNGRDGIPDDLNGDLVWDYYPTLTSTQVANEQNPPPGFNLLLNENPSNLPARVSNSNADTFAFPFIYPGMYSSPELASLDQNGAVSGWLHGVNTGATAGIITVNGVAMPANHAPLEFGDSIQGQPTPQTWWGFPTFRETASVNWRDPVYSPNGPPPPGTAYGVQVSGLNTFNPSSTPKQQAASSQSALNNLLPVIGSLPPLGTPGAVNAPYGTDPAAGHTLGVGSFVSVVGSTTAVAVSGSATFEQLSLVWDDDLIMTGVRSFDVKAYDINASLYTNPFNGGQYAAGYQDLGYVASAQVQAGAAVGNTLVYNTPTSIMDANNNPLGFGHEGRIPPLTTDNRVDPQRPIIRDPNTQSTTYNQLVYANNIGDNSTGLPRLRRVWDSWSTDYTRAPDVDINLRGSSLQNSPLDRPVYPSYPAPYPQALRGIQIQIRVVDPRNERVKLLTIRQDFTDKLN